MGAQTDAHSQPATQAQTHAYTRLDDSLDAIVAGFAIVTLIAHACVWLGGSLIHMITASAFAGVVLGALALRLRIRRSVPRDTSADAGERIAAGAGMRPEVRIAAAVWAVGLVGGYAATESIPLLWWGILGFGALTSAASFASFGAQRDAVVRSPTPPSVQHTWGLVALATFCALVAVCVHVPDSDDAFYLNLSVAAADHADAPLLAGDTLHGLPGVPLALPTYRLHSLELISGAIAYLVKSEIPPISHVLLPLVAAFLVPFALARVFRILTPERWLWSVVLAVLFLLAAGESPYSYGRLGFVRLYQGKAILLTLLIPLFIAYALEFARRPTRKSWLSLAAVQISAVGLSASALWLAPSVAGLALAAGVAVARNRTVAQNVKVAALGLLASAYLVALAFGLRAEIREVFATAAIALPSTQMSSAILAQESMRYVIWISPFAFATLGLTLLAFSTSSTAVLQSVVSIFCVGFALLFWNPYSAEWVAKAITGPPTYWRVLWVLPIPLFAAASLSAFVAPFERRGGAKWAVAACAMLGAALFALTHTSVLAPAANEESAWIGAPGWKIPSAEREAALELRRRVPKGDPVLAPRDVSLWLPALRYHPQPLIVRAGYLPLLKTALDDDEINRRLRLTNLVSGIAVPAHAARILAEAIEQYPLVAICVVESVVEREDIRTVLEQAGLQLVARMGPYQIWSKVLSSAVVASDVGKEG